MIVDTTKFTKIKVIYQDLGENDKMETPETAFIIGEDAGGTLFMQQEDQFIVLSRGTIPTLIKALKDYQ